jgi:hypothetical protein
MALGKRSDFIDITGQRFGSVVVLGYAGRSTSPSGGGCSLFKVRCDCGAELTRTSQHIRMTSTHHGCPLTTLTDEERHARDLKREKDRRRSWKEAGRCCRCSEPAERGRSRCKRHLLMARQDTARREQRNARQ